MQIRVSISLVISLAIVASACNGQWLSHNSASYTPEAQPDDTSATATNPINQDALDPLTDCSLSPNASNELPEIPFELPIPPKTIDWTNTHREEDTGIGYLGPVQSAMTPDTPDYLLVGYANEDWLKQIILPLYNAPEGDIEGWIACGWLMQGSPVMPEVLEAALFFPGYTGFGFIVLAEQDDWLQVRYGPAETTTWVLRSQLQSGLIPLSYIRWQDRYQAMITEHNEWITEERADTAWGYLNFDQAESAPLYASPNSEAEQISQIEPNHSFLPLKIQGDWMQVRVYQPASFCNLEWQGTAEEGWIRWMDAQQGGNQISEPYKGC